MQTTAKAKKDLCTPTPQKPSAKSIPLPLIDPNTGMKKSRAGRWRLYSLAAVHVFMVGHFLHWLWAGQTLTPVEPSESMDTIRFGHINMGLIFFALAILSTFVLGRWVCGWACHLVAYQDLMLWVLKKLHLRPKPFRTRFLFKVTTLVIAAGWMFLVPLGARLWSMIRQDPQPALTMHLTRTGYWDTFPGPLFGVLTILVAGFAIIYFLGPKGFCTYACPYGAFFAIGDRFARSRIRVTDACNQCGHCTASCTSNVSVAEEVKLYKMVVDPGCMKCLDCVEVCPNDALYVGTGKPAVFSRPSEPRKAAKYDLTLAEEFVALAIFVLVLVTMNGLYGEFPFLMSLAIAGIVTYVVMKAGRVLYAPDAMLQKIVLKVNGRIRPAGIAMLLLLALLTAFLGHSAVWRYHDLWAGEALKKSTQPPDNWQYMAGFGSRVSEPEKAPARELAEHIEAMQSWGLVDVPVHRLRLAVAYLFLDRALEGLNELKWATQHEPDWGLLWLWRARFETYLGQWHDAAASFEKAIECERLPREKLTAKVPSARHPFSAEVWTEWGRFLLRRGDSTTGGAALESAVKFDPGSAVARVALVEYLLSAQRLDDARRASIDAMMNHAESPALYERFDLIRRLDPSTPQIVAEYMAAHEKLPQNVAIINNLAVALTGQRRFDESIQLCRKGLAIAPESAGLRATLGATHLAKEDIASAISEFENLRKVAPQSGEAAIRLGFLYHRVGRTAEARLQWQEAERIGTPEEKRTAADLLRQPPS